MGVTGWVSAVAARRAHVLVVEVPGWWATRVAVERAVAARAWTLARSPADADVLVVAGSPGRRLAGCADRVWDEMPGPRARAAVTDPDGAGPALGEAADQLQDLPRQAADAGSRPGPAPAPADHDGMDMAPGGIPLAGGGPDRDGLEMDVLHVPLGPILPCWPAGLVLRCSLQGDVVTAAEVDLLDAPVPVVLDGSAQAARRCDDVARLLAVAGWDDGAVAARRARDALLDGRTAEATVRLDRLRSRVARSWSLRWMLRGLAPVDAAAHGLPPALGGDVHDRLRAMLADEPAAVTGAAVRAALPALVAGQELATVRLLVASLAPDTTPVAAVAPGG